MFSKNGHLVIIPLCLLCTFLTGCKQIQDEKVVDNIQEKTIGDWAAAQIQSESIGPTDPALIDDVNRIATRLDQVITIKTPPRILISDIDNDSTASLPGGWVVISARMVTLLEDHPDALAGVLAHEFAHVESDDSMRLMVNALGPDTTINMVTQGKYIDASNVAVQSLSFSHDSKEENDADAEGIRIAYRAGYDPQGLLTAIQLLRNVDPATDAVWLQVHPINSKRLRLINDDIASYPKRMQVNQDAK